MTEHLESPLDVARHGRVMVLTINNPQARNALHPDVYERGAAALAEASADPGTGAVILTGAGTTFCAGGNLGRLRANREKPREVQRASVEMLHGFVRSIRRATVPVIAAVEGFAAGAGFSLALACDLIVAAEDAKFVMAYVKVGLTPDGGGTAFLARGLPPQLAAELVMTGAPVGARRLHELGVINRLAEPGSVLDTARGWADELAAGPPEALGRAKRLIEAAATSSLDEQLDLEAELMTDAVHHAEAGEGIAAFLDKRKPDFTKV